jgi:hypothetical protein
MIFQVAAGHLEPLAGPQLPRRHFGFREKAPVAVRHGEELETSIGTGLGLLTSETAGERQIDRHLGRGNAVGIEKNAAYGVRGGGQKV